MLSCQNSWVWWSLNVVKGHTCFLAKWALMTNATGSLHWLFIICSEIKCKFWFRCFQWNITAWKQLILEIISLKSLFIPFNAIVFVLCFYMSALACWVNIWVQQCPFEFEKPFHGTDVCQNMWRNYREVLMLANTVPCACASVLVWIILGRGQSRALLPLTHVPFIIVHSIRNRKSLQYFLTWSI